MGWILLGLGIALWWGPHLFKRALPDQRAALGDKGKGLVALAIVAGIVLMTIGYRMLPCIHVWAPPGFMVHINNLLILIGIYMMTPAPKYGVVLNSWRHPMLTGFALWAVAHLLVNGDLASVVLFGSLLVWSFIERVAINSAEPAWTPRARGKVVMDGAFLVAAAVAMVIIGLIHAWLGYSVFGG